MERSSEPGRTVGPDGRIHYHWPPAGRFLPLWERFDKVFDDDEKHDLLALLTQWRHAESTMVAYTDPETGEWVDVEPDWSEPRKWLS